MRLRRVRFLKSAEGPASWPDDGVPEVAFGGRSNVGKSSLINTLTGRKALVRVSSTPGRTRLLNFIDAEVEAAGTGRPLRLCDLPGYGYAKVSKGERRKWGTMVERYVRERGGLSLVVLIVDARHDPTDQDVQMMEWLAAVSRPALVVATKIDKIGKDKRGAVLRRLREHLGAEVLPFSSVTGEGKDAVWKALLAHALGDASA